MDKLLNEEDEEALKTTLELLSRYLSEETIFEIVGMQTQEIKHSYFLKWLLSYQIDGHYVFFEEIYRATFQEEFRPTKLEIRREYENIDLLAIDFASNYVVAIENKLFAKERTKGDDNGQLQKYKEICETEFKDFQQKYVFLTPQGELASRKDWKPLSYAVIKQAVQKYLHRIDSIKESLLMNDYIKFLDKKGLTMNDTVKALWEESKYKEALEAISDYRFGRMIQTFRDRLEKRIEEKFENSSKHFYTKPSNCVLYTQEWKTYFGNDNPDIYYEDYFSLEFGYYITPLQQYIWVEYYVKDEKSGEVEEIWKKIKDKFNNPKLLSYDEGRRKQIQISIDIYKKCEDVVEESIDIFKEINKCFLSSKE